MISLAAHTMLFLAIAFVVRWKTEPAGPVSAELWGGLPPIVEVTPPPPPPPPSPKIERAPEPEPVKPDIVIEQKKPEPKPEPKPEKKVEPAKKVEPVKKVEPDKAELRKRDEEAKAEKAAQAAAQKQREVSIQRALAAAGPSSSPGAAGSAAGGLGLTDTYKGQVVGCIRPHIVFNVPEAMRAKQHVAEFEVQLLPSGEQIGAPRLVSGSGLAAYDQAVERAIRRCDPFPRPREGAMPRSLRLTFDPVDTR
jgi:colicin import membrane protein